MAESLVKETRIHDATRKQPPTICWYRSPVDREVMKELHQRSDLFGWLQAGGFLLLILCTGGLTYYSGTHWHWGITLGLLFLHGTCYGFMMAAVHELGHGTVFKTKALNRWFERLFAFLTMASHEIFDESHARHHRYTLHPPHDLEQVLPIKMVVVQFFKYGIFNFGAIIAALKEHTRLARGRFEYGAVTYPGYGRDDWEISLFPESEPEKRRRVINWARTLLIGHGLILAIAIIFKIWMLIAVVTLAPFIGGWLAMLCNAPQHMGLRDNVTDYRLCTRTIILSFPVRFLYWHMNYHIEHHMYAAVPCYKLHRLHKIIRHDLPACPKGLWATWRELFTIQRQQASDPTYQHCVQLPAQHAIAP